MLTEIWKPITFIPHYSQYEVSNTGKLRRDNTLLTDNSFSTKGYIVNRLYCSPYETTIARHILVFYTFSHHPYIETKEMTPDTLVVDHINGDKLNNNINNLQLITNRENIQKHFQTGPICSINIHNLEDIKYYPTRMGLDVADNNITNCLNKKTTSAGSRYWCYEEELDDFLQKIKNGEVKGKDPTVKVKATNLKTGEVKIYESLSEAARDLGCNRSNISNCLSGRQKTTKGCVFERVE